ncbi:MAG TPA: GntR family transcriptional regulator [Thermoleophilaceae bacterium]|nr:GntR family transcriptional regulator [Thermoleophilaceae bacterium]
MRETTDLTDVKLQTGLRERRITADYVAEALRAAIHRGDLADGAVLNQAAIASHFGVSRVPVREAMRQLQAEGLITTRAHRLAVVRSLSLERIVEIYDLRALLEGYVIERAVPKIDAALLKKLTTLEKEMRDVADHPRWLELNARFHQMLYEPADAEVTLELIEQLRARAERYVRLWSKGAGIHRPKEAGREHARILKLVEQGDGAGARQAIEEHVRHTRDRVIERGRQEAARNGASTDAE